MVEMYCEEEKNKNTASDGDRPRFRRKKLQVGILSGVNPISSPNVGNKLASLSSRELTNWISAIRLICRLYCFLAFRRRIASSIRTRQISNHSTDNWFLFLFLLCVYLVRTETAELQYVFCPYSSNEMRTKYSGVLKCNPKVLLHSVCEHLSE